MQKCLIAFYAKREILQISQRNLQDRAPNAQESEAQIRYLRSKVFQGQDYARHWICAGLVVPM